MTFIILDLLEKFLDIVESIFNSSLIDDLPEIVNEIESYASVSGMFMFILLLFTSNDVCSLLCKYKNVRILNSLLETTLGDFTFDNCNSVVEPYVVLVFNSCYVELLILYIFIAIIIIISFEPLFKFLLDTLIKFIYHSTVYLSSVVHKIEMYTNNKYNI